MSVDDKRTAFFAGSFDPPTLGHWDVINRALRVFDRLIIGIAVSGSKKPRFSAEQRRAMLAADFASDPRVSICLVEGLTYEIALDAGAGWLIRSLRNGTDFDYEMQMATANSLLSGGRLDTWFVFPGVPFLHISSSLVRELLSAGNNCEKFVTPSVLPLLSENP